MERHQIESGVSELVTRETTMNKLRKAGLFIPPKPEEANGDINLFTEWETMRRRHGGLSNIPYGELGEFLDRWTGMVSYARWCEAVADIDKSTASEVRDTIKDQLYTIQDGNRELRAAMVATEALYLEWEKKYLEGLSMYTAIKALREGYEGKSNAISREITRRGGDLEDTRRGINRGLQA